MSLPRKDFKGPRGDLTFPMGSSDCPGKNLRAQWGLRNASARAYVHGEVLKCFKEGLCALWDRWNALKKVYMPGGLINSLTRTCMPHGVLNCLKMTHVPHWVLSTCRVSQNPSQCKQTPDHGLMGTFLSHIQTRRKNTGDAITTPVSQSWHKRKKQCPPTLHQKTGYRIFHAQTNHDHSPKMDPKGPLLS